MSQALHKYLDLRRGRATELADEIGISRSYLSNIASGKKIPAPEKLLLLSQATGIPVTALISDDAPVDVVPIVSWVSAGPLLISDGVDAQHMIGTQIVSGLPKGDWVAFIVEGNSMDRVSPPGSVIFVNRAERKLIANACYVFADGEGGATYKRYRPDPTRLEAVAILPDAYPTIYPDNTPAVIGRVRRTMLEM